MRSPASSASSRPACEASLTGLKLLTSHPAPCSTVRDQPAQARPPGPQADRATALPNYLSSDLECLRSENALRFCYRVVVGTWCFARCFTRPPDHLGMPLAAHWSESILFAPITVCDRNDRCAGGAESRDRLLARESGRVFQRAACLCRRPLPLSPVRAIGTTEGESA